MVYRDDPSDDWDVARQSNRLDGGAPFYGVYECADGTWISIAPLEPQFHALFLSLPGLPDEDPGDRDDKARWPARRAEFATIFKRRTRAEWCALFEGTDVCFAPVLDPSEAAGHPHNRARAVFAPDPVMPRPAPRFGRTEPSRRAPLRPVAWEDIRDWPLA